MTLHPRPQRVVGADFGRQLRGALTNGVRAAFSSGWLPLDVVEQARRRLDERARPFLLDAIIAEHPRYAAASIDSRWQAQVDDLSAKQAPRRERPLLAQWVDRYGASRRDALSGMVSIAGFCTGLPPLPRLLPLPGTAQVRQRPAQTPVDNKMLIRIPPCSPRPNPPISRARRTRCRRRPKS